MTLQCEVATTMSKYDIQDFSKYITKINVSDSHMTFLSYAIHVCMCISVLLANDWLYSYINKINNSSKCNYKIKL